MTLSLASDPLTGPFSTALNITAGFPFTVVIAQVTVGPSSIVSVNFGDGSITRNFTITAAANASIPYNYTTSGTFNITVKPFVANYSLQNNIITAFVAETTFYTGCKFFFAFLIH
jgi:hypothetical protein